MEPDISQFKVGTILLYSSHSLVDDLIRWKEAGQVAHIEIYAGNGKTWASRNGVGYGNKPWDFTPTNLVEVRFPLAYFNPEQGEICFETKLKGMPYGNMDIVDNITGQPTGGKGLDCSHGAAILLEDGGAPQFASDYPKQIITPEHYRIVRENTLYWKAPR